MVVAPRLENVLKRAEELEAMQKAPAALDALFETVQSRRTRSMGLEQLEPVFSKFISLAVELRRGKVVKDGLQQFKKLVLPTGDEGVSALISAISSLLSQSEDAVAKAQQQAEEVQVDDLEEESPQNLLLAMVSSEEAKDRTDREVVTPWLKFLWENYRSVLDVLRNNSKLETAYADVASQAFSFCARYGRKTEFRRLAELLRTHLQYAATQSKAYHTDMAAARAQAVEQAGTKDVTAAQIAMHMPQNTPQNPIDLSDADTLQRFLDTRFEQLNIAVKLELWQEAFRSVEDVHTLLTATHRPIPVGSMSTYYETLARVFAVSHNHLFHAATWFRYFVMLSSRRAPEQELRRIASCCVLSLLCVPHTEPPAASSGRSRRWMALINLQRCPTRQGLIDAALARSVLSFARPELRELFVLFEQDFNPLTFRDNLEKLAPALAEVKEFQPYFRPLLEVAATTVFNELATSYTEAKLDFVLGLVSLPAPFSATPAELERLLVRGSAHGYHVRIDHQQGVVRFVDSLSYPLAGTAGAFVRSELFELANLLSQTPGLAAQSKVAEIDYQAKLERESRAYLERHEREQQRTEAFKQEKQRKEEEQQRERARAAEEEKYAQQAKAQAEEQQRVAALLEKQRAEVAMAEKRALAESINAKGHLRVDMDQLAEMSMSQLQNMQVEQLDQEARSLDSRMGGVARRYDHLERAWRREEAKYWTKDGEEQNSRDKEVYNRRKEAIINGARRSHEIAQEYANRFARVRADYEAFKGDVKKAHDARVAELRAKNAELLAAAKEQRIAEVTERRIAEEASRKQRAEEEEKRRIADEAERQKRAEEDAAAEQRRHEAKLRAEQIRKEAEAARAQRAVGGGAPAAQPSARPPPPSAGAYRPPQRSNPFGRATAGAPADVSRPPAREASQGPAHTESPPATPAEQKPNKYVPRHARR